MVATKNVKTAETVAPPKVEKKVVKETKKAAPIPVPAQPAPKKEAKKNAEMDAFPLSF